MIIGYKFILKRDDGVKFAVKSEDENLDFPSLLDLFKSFSVGCGYTQETIDKFISEVPKTTESDIQ